MIKNYATGQLTIKPRCAKLTKDKSFIFKMSTYCAIVFGRMTSRTKIDSDSGLNPKWEDIFTYSREQENLITVQIYHTSFLQKDVLLGQSDVSLIELFQRLNLDKECPIFYENKEVGKVFLTMEWRPIINYIPNPVYQINPPVQFSNMNNFNPYVQPNYQMQYPPQYSNNNKMQELFGSKYYDNNNNILKSQSEPRKVVFPLNNNNNPYPIIQNVEPSYPVMDDAELQRQMNMNENVRK